MSNFRKALMFTSIPIVVLFLIHIVVMLTVDARFDVRIGIGEQIGWGACGLLVIALIAAIVYNIRGFKQTAKGIWWGFGIGLVALIVTFIVTTFIFP
jgi:uncharacterized PurR-regulated membrane protein YhhQ (DUF165 family)